MTQSAKPISPLRQRMHDEMRLRKLSPKTQSLRPRGQKLHAFSGSASRYRHRRRPKTFPTASG